MFHSHRLALVVTAVATVLVAIGCSDDVGEPGPGSGSSSGASSSSGDLADAGGEGDSSSSGKKKIGETGCAADEDCESNACFKGNAQSFCTVRCTGDTATSVCVAPLTGTCNKQGYCKRD
jgi:hypothetical protein